MLLLIWNGHKVFYFLLCLSGISESRKRDIPSVQLSVRPLAFLYDGWMDFLRIGYHDQVQWVIDVCKIEFGYLPNWSNYGHFFIKF